MDNLKFKLFLGRFEGEDLASVIRRKEQKLLQKEWLEQQVIITKDFALKDKFTDCSLYC